MEAYDDVSGQELVPELMIKARQDEIAYFRDMGVYEKVDVHECWKQTGKAPIAVRWVDTNKGDSAKPNYRSRLVAKEFNTGPCPELYAATPPSECLRILRSKMASGRNKGIGLVYADVSRAYFYAKASRDLYIELPKEDPNAGPGVLGKLELCLYLQSLFTKIFESPARSRQPTKRSFVCSQHTESGLEVGQCGMCRPA